MSKFIKAVASAALLATSATGSAQAAALNTDVDVTLPSIIALYCYDKVDVNVTTAGFVAATGANDSGATGTTTTSTGPTDATSPSAGNWEAAVTGLDTSTGGTIDTTVDLTMTGVCAFRALATSAGVNVSIDRRAADGDIPHETVAAAKIVATSASLVNGGAAVSDYDVTTGLGLANVNPITVRLPLDLSAATVAGKYTTADLFTVTVSAN